MALDKLEAGMVLGTLALDKDMGMVLGKGISFGTDLVRKDMLVLVLGMVQDKPVLVPGKVLVGMVPDMALVLGIPFLDMEGKVVVGTVLDMAGTVDMVGMVVVGMVPDMVGMVLVQDIPLLGMVVVGMAQGMVDMVLVPGTRLLESGTVVDMRFGHVHCNFGRGTSR